MTSVQHAQRFLGDWLATETWKPGELKDWLVDKHFPLPDSEEPFVWFIRGLPEGDSYRWRRVFAERLAALLSERPDVNFIGPERPRFLYNLLSVSAAILDQREVLGPPLLNMYWRQKNAGVLDGQHYQDLPLSQSLRVALTVNQINRDLRSDWLAMLCCESVQHMAGTPFDGLQGLTWLPPSSDENDWGDPSLGDLGGGFALLAHHLSGSLDRRFIFRAQIQHVEQIYPGREWGYDFLMQADKNAWPRWTAQCLPCLWIDRDDSVITWMGSAGPSFAEHFHDDIEAKYMSCEFLQIAKTNPVLQFLGSTVAGIEMEIDGRPGMSENEYLAQDRHMFQECDMAVRASENCLNTVVSYARQSIHRLFAASID